MFYEDSQDKSLAHQIPFYQQNQRPIVQNKTLWMWRAEAGEAVNTAQ